MTERTARITRRVPLLWRDGGDAASDRPPHVRAASGVTFFGMRVVVVQDDVNYVAWVDPETGLADPLQLAAGAGGRRRFEPALGNKADKRDFEAVAVLQTEEDGIVDDVLMVFGSGSTPARERVVLVRESDVNQGLEVLELEAHAWYASLRACAAFAGRELNLEGAVVRGDQLVLFQRGNGARGEDGTPAANATACVSVAELLAHLADEGPVPALTGVVARPLGALPGLAVQDGLNDVNGVRLTFTDATAGPFGHEDALVFLAAAERSPNSYDDGEVLGSAIGVIAGPEGPTGAPVLLTEADGTPFRGKAEGIVLVPGTTLRAYVVTDRDDAAAPAELLEVALDGPWF